LISTAPCCGEPEANKNKKCNKGIAAVPSFATRNELLNYLFFRFFTSGAKEANDERYKIKIMFHRDWFI